MVGIFSLCSSWHANSKQAVTGVYRNCNFFNTPEWATIHVLENDFHQPIAVLVHHGICIRQGPSYSPVEFRSDLTWKQHDPSRSGESGVWIDGKKQRLGGDLAVLYATETGKTRVLHIHDDDKVHLLADARSGGDPLHFVHRWIRLD